MTKKEFTVALQNNAGLKTKAEAEELTNAFLATIEETLKAGEEINFIGWGKFETSQREARVGRNPQTGAEIEIAAKKVIKFKAGKALSDSINK